ncbi:hypothetical protein GCM10027020_31910 [Nocardioides salsibiostraticola]
MTAGGSARAHGWVQHLRGGGTTPWVDWDGWEPHTPPDQGGAGQRAVPGAQQLELLRRLNLAAQPVGHVPGPLIDRVLEASAPGRGAPDLELAGAAQESSFGPRPVDPTDLAPDELIRVAAGLVAEDLVEAGTPPLEQSRLVGLTRRLAPAYRLVGDPWAAPLIRADLRRQGRVPGGRDASAYVLATGVEDLVANAWVSRCFGEGAPPWRAWLDPFVSSDHLPPRADLVRIAARHEAPELLFDAELLPRLLRRRGLPSPTVPPVIRPSADAAETARRVGATLDLLVLPQQRADLLIRTLLPRLAATSGPALRLPKAARPWAQAQGERMIEAVKGAGYRVHGDPVGLCAESVDGVTGPSDAGVLDLLLGLLLGPVGVDGRVTG